MREGEREERGGGGKRRGGGGEGKGKAEGRLDGGWHLPGQD